MECDKRAASGSRTPGSFADTQAPAQQDEAAIKSVLVMLEPLLFVSTTDLAQILTLPEHSLSAYPSDTRA
jgi:hypothetical protein